MSGQYRTEPSQLDSEWTAILSPDGDRLTAVRTTLDAAEVVVAELNRLHSLAARSGSPEGWPEGAEPATLGAEVACVGDRDHSVLACDQTAAVLVEEPNG